MSIDLNRKLPEEFLQSLYGLAGFNRESFEQIHSQGKELVSIRLNPAKINFRDDAVSDVHASGEPVFSISRESLTEKVPWCPTGYYLPERPSFTFDPLFHAGVYYVQEASSMFLAYALRQVADLSVPLRVLDLCASPGGKSTLIQSLLSGDSLLVSNEPIRSRLGSLQENMTKWGGHNGIICHNDPAAFGEIGEFFDILVADAPCSGSGLFRREPDAVQGWSPETVNMCSLRQQRILADALPCLKPGGILIYSTCSYSAEENEEIADWLIEDFALQPVSLSPDPAWHIIESGSPVHEATGYRFYPDRLDGEGFYLCCLRKPLQGGRAMSRNPVPGTHALTRAEQDRVRPWVSEDPALALFKQENLVYAMPAAVVPAFSYLRRRLYLRKAGVLTGMLTNKELVPHHELAMSGLCGGNIPSIPLTQQQAIRYLQRDVFQPAQEARGWALVTFRGINLGWVKLLGARVNNYYPVEWRILKRNL